MRRRRHLALPLGLVLAAACSGDMGSGPADPGDGARLASEFENLADEVGDSGATASANALRHAALVVRLVGHATPVSVTVDGVQRDWLAVAEQLDYPMIQCVWPATGMPGEGDGTTPPDSGSGGGGSVGGGTGGGPGEPECTETGTSSVRSIIAWEPEHMDEVVRMTAEPGSSEVKPAGVPDVMAGLPTPSAPSEPGDTAITGGGGGGGGGGGTYGFMGEYLKADGGIFWTVEGTQSNSREPGSGSCTASHVTFDWAEFDCDAVRLRFEVEMRVEGGQMEPLMGRPGPDGTEGGSGGDLETHTIALRGTTVDGAVLTVTGWTAPNPQPGPPPEPGPGPDPVPVDSSTTH